MRYRLLGHSGLRVSELCLGAMTFGDDRGWGASPAESRRIFDAFAEAGGNFIDTADIYTAGTSEKLVGEFVAGDRERFVLATKYSNSAPVGDPNAAGNHRKNMVQSLEASLKRMQLDYIDLYWLHAWDFMTPVEEVMRAFDDLVRAGKILYAGISDTPAWIVSRADALADFRGWSRFVAIQVEYSLVERTVERELLPMAKALDLGVTAWSPLGSGLLTGKYTRDADQKTQRRLDQEAFKEIDDEVYSVAREVDRVAEELGKSSSQVALNWLRQRGGVLPIIGARTLDQFRENCGCLDFSLEGDQIERLNKVSQIELGFPHDFLASEVPRNFLYGGLFDRIDPR
ncbi:MAG: aldo/keto reductase [Desulfobacterales bacterium]|nr:aldo/keto reductase [Desulfobacterales bacterium]MDJ0886721.1 aldo/keto reductase [Desulfobacterales bacterium]